MPLLPEVTSFFRRASKKIKTKEFAILPLSLILLVSIPSGLKTEKFKTDLKLDTASAFILTPSVELNKVIPGDSLLTKEERAKEEEKIRQEQAQAAAKAAAEAAEKARQAELASSRQTVSRERRVYSDPADLNGVYVQAGSVFGVDPKLLRAVHLAETGGSSSSGIRSYAGAVGPMQFLPSTFRSYAVDGNGDGRTDITNVEDAIFSAAKYLKACGAPDIKKALWGYNPSTSYFNKVTRIMASL